MRYFYVTLGRRDDLMINEKMKLDKALSERVLQEVATLLQNLSESEFTAEIIREKSIEKIAKMGLKNGQFLSPFRVALSGLERSAGPFEICEVLGKAESLRRVNVYL